MYEFFKSQGAVVVNDAADFAGTNGFYLYQGRDVKEDKSLKDQILVIAPHEALVPSDVWLRGGEGKVNPKITAYQVELAQVEAEIEKLLDTLTRANATLLTYANKKIEDLDNRRKTLSKAIADLSVETLSFQQIELLPGYLTIGSISALRTNEKPLTG